MVGSHISISVSAIVISIAKYFFVCFASFSVVVLLWVSKMCTGYSPHKMSTVHEEAALEGILTCWHNGYPIQKAAYGRTSSCASQFGKITFAEWYDRLAAKPCWQFCSLTVQRHWRNMADRNNRIDFVQILPSENRYIKHVVCFSVQYQEFKKNKQKKLNHYYIYIYNLL